MQLFMFAKADDLFDAATIDSNYAIDNGYFDDDEYPDSVHVGDLLEHKLEDDTVHDWKTGANLWDDIVAHGVQRPVLLGFTEDFPKVDYAGDAEIALMDGHHRVAGAMQNDLYVPVEWISDMSEAYASWGDNWQAYADA